MQKPFVGRAKIREQDTVLEITVSRRKNLFFIFGALFSIAIFGFFAALPFYQTPTMPVSSTSRVVTPVSFQYVLIISSIFGVITLFYLNGFLIYLINAETVSFSDDLIHLTELKFIFKTEREYTRVHISRLRSLQIPESDQSISAAPSLAFDYGAKTIRFGRGIDEAEATQILERVIAKFPQYRSSSAVGIS